MKKCDELFEKIIYDSDDFKNMQKELDNDIEKLLMNIEKNENFSKEDVRDELNKILFKTERQTFGVTLKYGIDLINEYKLSSNDINNL